jgi:hypothetical protein
VEIVGIDCATNDAKVGVAWAIASPLGVRVMDASVCSRAESALDRVARCAAEAGGPVLIAIDAPLGWPRAMGEALASHQAGAEIAVLPNDLFRRVTDRHIQARVRKTPLDAGADRIVRTDRLPPPGMERPEQVGARNEPSLRQTRGGSHHWRRQHSARKIIVRRRCKTTERSTGTGIGAEEGGMRHEIAASAQHSPADAEVALR